MGLIAKLLSFARAYRNSVTVSEAKVDTGGGVAVTALHAAPPGDDSQPLYGDYAAVIELRSTGRKVAVGYFDSTDTAQAAPGEKRLYARGPDGEAICTVWLKNTGEISIFNKHATFSITPGGAISGENKLGNFILEESGDFKANGVTLDITGDVVTSDGISLRLHTHLGNLGIATSTPVPAPPAP